MASYLAIDQGTHASRAAVFDERGRRLAIAEQKVDLKPLGARRVEQDPQQLLDSVRRVVNDLTASRSGLVTAGMAVQRSTLVAWHRDSGRALAPAISWQDTRARDVLKPLSAHSSEIRRITGLPCSPHYLAGKMIWLLRNHQPVQDAAATGKLCFGPLASFLAFHLLEEQPFIVDHSNAGRSLLFDLARLQWHPQLLAWFGIDPAWLPQPVPMLARHGKLLDHGIPLSFLGGDQNAAIRAAAHGGDQRTALVNIGTGAFVLQIRDHHFRPVEELISGIAQSTDRSVVYLVEGTVNGAGSALSWWNRESGQTPSWEQLERWLQRQDTGTVFINGIGGLGSPWWVEQVPARFSPSTDDPAEQAIAIIESIVFLLQANLERMTPDSPEMLMVSGGLAQLNGLCQRLADLSGLAVQRIEDPEATLRGAACFAAGQPRSWEDPATAASFTPEQNPGLSSRYHRFLALLQDAFDSNPREVR